MKRLYSNSIGQVIALAAIASFTALGTGCALDGSSQTEGTQEGVSSSVDNIISGNDSKNAGQGSQAGNKGTAQDPRAVAEQRVAPQPQPWRSGSGAAGSDDPNQPQPQPWNPNPDPSDPNNQKH